MRKSTFFWCFLGLILVVFFKSQASPKLPLLANKNNNIVFSDSLVNTPTGAVGDSIHNQLKDSLTTTDSLTKSDSTFKVVADTINKNDTAKIEEGEIKDPINYKADDSIVYELSTKKMYMYNKADIQYQKIKLNSYLVDFDWTTFTMGAHGTTDSLGHLAETPIFSEDGKEYKADSMRYNFKTKKGLVYHVVTKEGDAYIHSEAVKKNEFDEWYGLRSAYTSCDLDHPHFYFKAKKVKIVPDKVMITGPTNLWIADVPTPLYLPFGIFPVKQGRRSGLVVPEYGSDAILGFFLRKGGYYWAVNDYLSLKFLGQISTNGTWGLGLASSYALKYKFTGNFAVDFTKTRPQDPDIPGAASTIAYSLIWTHTQDPRSLPNSTFGVNINYQSSSYFDANRVTDNRRLTAALNSSINYGHTFVGTPFSFSAVANAAENLTNGTVQITLPTMRLSMSRVAPFKAKVKSDKPKWFENIGFTYSLEFQNRISTYDSVLFRSETANRMAFGFNQNFAVDAPFRLFKYLNVTPSVQYQERTYFRGTNETWDPDTVYSIASDGRIDTIRGRVKTDTVWRFNSSRNFSASIAFSTKAIGIYRFNGKVKALKHIFTPTVSANYQPDFGTDFWKYSKSVQIDAQGRTGRYSTLDPAAIYGIPPTGKVGSITWNLANNLEMKVYSKTDSVNHEKKVGLFDQLGLSGGYNFAADSLRLLPFNLTAVSSRLFNLINLNFSAVFDPYAVDSHSIRINKYEWNKDHKLLRFTTANIGASLNLHSKQKPALANTNAPAPRYFGDYVSYNPDQIYNFDIPWNITLTYNFNITQGTWNNPDTFVKTQTLRLQADFNLTPKWKIAVSTGFDISHKQVTLTNITVVRDLHCWELAFNWSPLLQGSVGGQFSIVLQPKSTTLKDLKLTKKNSLGSAFSNPGF